MPSHLHDEEASERASSARREGPAGMKDRPQSPHLGVTTPRSVLGLQRTIGNQAVVQLLRADRDEELDGSSVRHVVGSGGGSPMRPDLRSEMEQRFGEDFSDVRVHTDHQAASSARDMQAQAYTVGPEIVFGSGQYAPDTAAGKKMLAHELTHVVQQRSGPVSGSPAGGGVMVSDPSDAFERAADANSAAVMEEAGPASGATSVQRQEDESGEEQEEQAS